MMSVQEYLYGCCNLKTTLLRTVTSFVELFKRSKRYTVVAHILRIVFRSENDNCSQGGPGAMSVLHVLDIT